MHDSTMRATKWLPGAALLMLASLQLQAAEGNYEINQACAAAGCFSGDSPGYPITITVPGSYELTSDLNVTGGNSTNGIEVSVSMVNIDLNGHVLNGGGSCAGTPVTSCSGSTGGRGIQISGTGPVVLHVHDGVIRGFSQAGIVSFATDSGTRFDHLLVTENQYGVAIIGDSSKSSIEISDCTVSRNSGDGLTFSNNVYSNFRVTRSVFAGNQFNGVFAGDGSTLTDNTFTDNGNFGIRCFPTPSGVCAVGRNSFYGNNGGGALAQWSIPVVRDMAGNVCLDDGNCP